MTLNSTKLDISNLNTQFPVPAWNTNPGQWICVSSETPQKAQRIFDQFVTKKMPEALRLIEQLNNAKHLSSVHLPMNIYSVFICF